MKVGSLFTGYGGLDSAARAVFGGELAWVSDNHPSAVKLLAHRHPTVPNLGDITAVDWEQVERVALLCAGFPCTDISDAGQKAGIEGEHSGLWSHIPKAVRVLRPRHVVLENVERLLVRGFDRVVADLAAVGYDLRWRCVRASDIGAPHRRSRWFGYATPSGDTTMRGRGVASTAGGRQESARPAGGPDLPATNAADHGRDELHDRASGDGACGSGQRQPPGGAGLSPEEWGKYWPAINRWQRRLGRPAPNPVLPSGRGGRLLSPWFEEWMMGLPAGWVTDVPGLTREEMIRLLGNGVVPQQGEAALRWLVQAESMRGVA